MDLKTAYSFKRVWKEQVFDSDFLQRTETEGSLIVKKNIYKTQTHSWFFKN
jgi:hypothetical protein